MTKFHLQMDLLYFGLFLVGFMCLNCFWKNVCISCHHYNILRLVKTQRKKVLNIYRIEAPKKKEVITAAGLHVNLQPVCSSYYCTSCAVTSQRG